MVGVGLLLATPLHWQKTYWTDSGTDKIQRSNQDGNSVEDIVTGPGVPVRVAMDASGGKVYWVDEIAAKHQRANLD